eukprot:2613223-Prymnesium_polylepis.1
MLAAAPAAASSTHGRDAFNELVSPPPARRAILADGSRSPNESRPAWRENGCYSVCGSSHPRESSYTAHCGSATVTRTSRDRERNRL